MEFNYFLVGDLFFGCFYFLKLFVEVLNFVSLGDCVDDLVELEELVVLELFIIEEFEIFIELELEEFIDKEEYEGELIELEKFDKFDEL